MKLDNFKKYFMRVVIASLIGAASIAVIAVLVGEFNDTLAKALFTLGLVAIHALASLTYLDSREKSHVSEELAVFSNFMFGMIVLSFLTSIFGVWELFDGEVVGKLYLTYFIFVFASLHAEMLVKTMHKEKRIDNIVLANFMFMAVVVLMLMPVVWAPDTQLADVYYRILAAAGIVDATLTILAVILHKMYLQKHPEEKSMLFEVQTVYDKNGNPIKLAPKKQSRKMHPLLALLLIYLVLQVFVPLIWFAA